MQWEKGKAGSAIVRSIRADYGTTLNATYLEPTLGEYRTFRINLYTLGA